MATRTAKGTATAKASGTTLQLNAVSVESGSCLVVGISCDNAQLSPSTVTHAGRTLRRRQQQNDVPNSRHTSIWLKGEYRGNQTGPIVATWGGSIGPRAMFASSWDRIVKLDQGASNADTTATTTPSTGTTATLAVADALVICVFGSRGPGSDHGSATARIQDGGSFTAATIGQIAGTGGAPPPSNATVVETYLELTSTTATQGDLQSATSRTWASVIIALEDRPAAFRQGITPTDTGAVDDIVIAAGGDVDDVYYHFNELTGLWEAYETTTPGTLRAIRDGGGAWS